MSQQTQMMTGKPVQSLTNQQLTAITSQAQLQQALSPSYDKSKDDTARSQQQNMFTTQYVQTIPNQPAVSSQQKIQVSSFYLGRSLFKISLSFWGLFYVHDSLSSLKLILILFQYFQVYNRILKELPRSKYCLNSIFIFPSYFILIIRLVDTGCDIE